MMDMAESRFFRRIKCGVLPSPYVGRCWDWQGFCGSGGYGRFRHAGRMVQAHRFAYIAMVGEIPAGLELDHLCRNRACVNPAHLEPVTRAENVRRGVRAEMQRAKTHCPHGHPYAGDNVAVGVQGSRRCRTCAREGARARRAATRTGKPPGHYGRPGESAEHCREVLRRFDAGETAKALATAYGVTPEAIYKQMKKARALERMGLA